MNTTKNHKLNISFLPLSFLCGIFTGVAVFLFKYFATYVIRFSKWAYTLSAQKPIYIPLLLLGITLVSGIIHFILKTEPQVKGGGIPTAVKFIREGKSFNVIKNIILVPVSALFTFLSGVPLGNEGPSVQLGCAMGEGVSKFSKKNIAENRSHIMSAGACAGFGVATGAPLSGILFSVEEIKGKISYKMMFSVIISTLTAAATAKGLCYLTGAEYNLFHIEKNDVLPIKYIWIPIVVGLVTGLAVLFHRVLCTLYDALEKRWLHKINLFVKIEIILLVSAVPGLFSQMYIGTGHDIAHHLLEGESVGLLLLISALILRIIMLTFANKTGITGGLFVPSLALGALIGIISANVLGMMGVFPTEYSFILVIMGMTAFLGIRSKMPFVALLFAVEALNGLYNIIPITLCVVAAQCVIKISQLLKKK